MCLFYGIMKVMKNHQNYKGANNPFFGKKHTEETKKKLSEMRMGKKASMEARLKMSKSQKGRKYSLETRKKISESNIGRIISDEQRRKTSERNIGNKYCVGRILSEETKKKISESRLKNPPKPYWLGKHLSAEHKKNVGIGRRKYVGELASNWRGGKSFEPYSLDWRKTLKIAIRERDDYACQICGEKQGNRALDVHHIDYNKLNCNPENLISLCLSCHRRTNGKRDYWTDYFNDKIQESGI